MSLAHSFRILLSLCFSFFSLSQLPIKGAVTFVGTTMHDRMYALPLNWPITTRLKLHAKLIMQELLHVINYAVGGSRGLVRVFEVLEVLLQVELENYKIYGAEKQEMLDALSVECSKLKERGQGLFFIHSIPPVTSIQQADELIKRRSPI